jgi:hypothetical protein
MTAILQLCGAKRTYLLAKNFFQPAAAKVAAPPRSKLGVVGKKLPAPRPMLPLQRWRESAAGPTTYPPRPNQHSSRIAPSDPDVLPGAERSCFTLASAALGSTTLISGSEVRALVRPPSSPPKLAVGRWPPETACFRRIPRGSGIAVFASLCAGLVSRALFARWSPAPKIPFLVAGWENAVGRKGAKPGQAGVGRIGRPAQPGLRLAAPCRSAVALPMGVTSNANSSEIRPCANARASRAG